MKKVMVGIVGVGEVGSAISIILSKKFLVFKKDINFDEIAKIKIDFLHICIPYNNYFIKEVIKQIRKCKPKLTIIHATIGVGITRKIYKNTNLPIVHSPVRGTHPNLEKDIKKFVKYVGPVNAKSAKLAFIHLQKAGLKVELMKNPEETELGKLLDTTYYGWNILFTKLVGRLCEDLSLDFDNVYTKFNKTYNEGYRKSKPQVLRPILKYSHSDDKQGGIGGHCIMENTKLLNEQYHLNFTKFLIEENEKLKKHKKGK